MDYSVGITTYYARFNDWFKPLVLEILKQRPEVEIIVAINGEHNLPFKEDYRKKMLEFITPHPNIFPIFYPRFRSIPRTTNLNLQFASNDTVLLLQDDIILKPGFFDEYEALDRSNLFYINRGPAAWNINRKEFEKLNWLDERFLSIGHEDQHFAAKYELINHKTIPNNEMKTVFLDGIIIENEPRLANQRKCRQFGRYAAWDEEVRDKAFGNLFGKDQYPLEPFYWRNKDKL